jgi:hypothetical protein
MRKMKTIGGKDRGKADKGQNMLKKKAEEKEVVVEEA